MVLMASYIWHRIGSTNSNALTDYFKDILAEKMISVDVAKAKAMARECMSRKYTKGGY